MVKKGFKFQVIDRDPNEYVRQRSGDIRKIYHTTDPTTHKFQEAREYTRALNATKLDKMFAKPFVAALDAHTDGIYSLCKIPTKLPFIVAGDGDGVIKLWNLGTQRAVWNAIAHQGRVRGLACESQGKYAVSCASDRTIKLWNISLNGLNNPLNDDEITNNTLSLTTPKISDTTPNENVAPLQVLTGNGTFHGIDHHLKKPVFVTCGETVDVWDSHSATPLHSFQWGADTVNSVKFNHSDTDVICTTGSDRSVVLYDIRTQQPMHKLVLYNNNNDLSWNPQEPFRFVVASEDTNVYQFDMRNLSQALKVHRGHTSAVLSVDFSPTGENFASGSYDKTIRLWKRDDQKSDDIYSTKRMQHVFAIQYSQDARYVVSGSDDANVRIWKANSSERLGVVNQREREQLEYREKLTEKYSNMSEIHRINSKKLVPKRVKVDSETRRIKDYSRQRKEENVKRAHHGKSRETPSLKKSRIYYQEE